jgi:hypothetical protein
MTKVLLLRSNPFQCEHILRALCLVAPVTDVHDQRDVCIERISLDDSALRFRGMPLADFTHALLLGDPGVSPLSGGPALPPGESEFETNERAVGLSSGLLLSGVRVLSPGLLSGAAAGLASKPGQVAFLAKLGWRTPSLQLTRSTLGEETRTYEPDLGSLRRLFLCVTRRRELVFPAPEADVRFARRELDALSDTRRAMIALGLDWLTLPLGVAHGRVWAFGASTDLPPELGDGGTSALLASCLDDADASPPAGAN